MQTIFLFGTLLVVATLGATSVHAADKQVKMNKRLATCEKKSKVVHKKIANLKSDLGDALESAFGCNAGKYAASDNVACQVWTNPTADDCADGSIWTTGSSTEDSTCVPCAGGHFSASDNAACKVWTYAAADDCANGSIWTTGSTSEDSTCMPCAAGQFSASDNAACKVWTDAAADDCANGSIWTTGSTTEDSTCVPCAAGQFSASDNAACAPHTSCGEQMDGSTRLTGASPTAAGSCEVCDGKTLAESAAANCVRSGPLPTITAEAMSKAALEARGWVLSCGGGYSVTTYCKPSGWYFDMSGCGVPAETEGFCYWMGDRGRGTLSLTVEHDGSGSVVLSNGDGNGGVYFYILRASNDEKQELANLGGSDKNIEVKFEAFAGDTLIIDEMYSTVLFTSFAFSG